MRRHPRDIDELVDEEIGKWRVEQARVGPKNTKTKQRPRVIAMSHAVGSGGFEIARLAGQQLGLPVYDREIVQHISSTAHVHRAVVESLDAHARSRVEEYVGSLFTGLHFDRSDYLRLLARTVGALWEHGPCIITGHGCTHLVPRTHALTVRTVARGPDRVSRLAEREDLPEDQAERRLQQEDKERAEYHQKYFNADVEDSSLFDLVLNSSDLSLADCATLVAQAYRLRFPFGG